MPDSLSSLSAALFVVLLGIIWHFSSSKGTRKPFPPGPRGLPLVNNLFNWPRQNAWEGTIHWKAQYGNMVYAKLAGQPVIILYSVQAAKSMLSGKGSIYSDRQALPFLRNLGGWDRTIVFSDDGPNVKAMRRPFSQWLGSKSAIERLQPVIVNKACQYYTKIAKGTSGKELQSYLRTLMGSIILDITYGYQAKTNDDHLVEVVEKTMLDMAYARPGSNILDMLPWIQYLPSWAPGMGYRQVAAAVKDRLDRAIELPFQYTKSQLTTGTARYSVVASALAEHELDAGEESLLKSTAAGIFAGASDTTVSAISSFFILMALHPNVQSKAQAEVDAVVGNSRLPTLADRERLLYVNALVSEILRYCELAPFGVPHVLRQDDIHEGYFIPKGTWAVPNCWAMSRDPLVYESPEAFNPERFLGGQPEADPREYIFGFGRRICPGLVFADNALFLEVAICLATLQITKKKDEHGVPIVPVLEYQGDAVRHPNPAPCEVAPRSMYALDLLHANTEAL